MKFITLLSSMLALSATGYCQVFAPGPSSMPVLKTVKKSELDINGFIVSKGDTSWGTIVVPIIGDGIHFRSMLRKVTFRRMDGNVEKYKPGEIEGYGVRGEHDKYDFISLLMPGYNPESLFLREVIGGKIRLLEADFGVPEREEKTVGLFPQTTIAREKMDLMYVVVLENGEQFRLQTNERSRVIRKKSIRPLLEIIPALKDEEEVSIAELKNAIEDFNIASEQKQASGS